MTTYNIHDAKTHFSRLIEKAAGGEEVVIAKAGKPMAKLVPLNGTAGARPRRRIGLAAGKYKVPDTFLEPLPDDVLAEFERPLFGDPQSGQGE